MENRPLNKIKKYNSAASYSFHESKVSLLHINLKKAPYHPVWSSSLLFVDCLRIYRNLFFVSALSLKLNNTVNFSE
jgi:hypothetical protein